MNTQLKNRLNNMDISGGFDKIIFRETEQSLFRVGSINSEKKEL